jgi:hypothetical protein
MVQSTNYAGKISMLRMILLAMWHASTVRPAKLEKLLAEITGAIGFFVPGTN